MSDGPAETAMRAALEIETARTLESIKKSVRGFATPYGYDRFVLFSASTASEEVVEHIYWVEGDWFDNGQAVDAETYVRHCPVTRHLLNARQSFFWQKEQVKGEERYRMIRSPGGPGIQGLQVPVFGPQGLEGAMSLGGSRWMGARGCAWDSAWLRRPLFSRLDGCLRRHWTKR